MMSRHLISMTVIIFIASGLLATPAQAHPFHSSAAEMDWNEKTRCYEVAWKVDPNDLEQELRRRTKRLIILEELKKPDVVFNYLNNVFEVDLNGKKTDLKPVGFEVNSKDAWIYFEIPVASKLADMKITNRLLLAAPHQTNTLLIQHGKQRLSISFTEQKQTCQLKWNATTKMYELISSLKNGNLR